VAGKKPIFRDVSDSQWSDWRWQLKNRIVTADVLAGVIELTEDEKLAIDRCTDQFRMAITPYYPNLMDASDPECPIRRQGVPSPGELFHYEGEMTDPLAEEAYMPVRGLTHRYPDRALLYTSHNCPMYCRFCTRKRKVSDPASATAHAQITEALDYIERTEAIKDVIISGGDPLSLSTDRLESIFQRLISIPHVEIARLATRNLVTLPQRIDDELCQMLQKIQTRDLSVFVLTHFNHPRECTDDAWAACERILATGTPILNQTVLLRGINDHADTIAALNRQLLRMRVKPYYLHHADMAEGIGHFRTTIDEGIAILRSLRGFHSGVAVPQYVVDLPGGGGKVPVIPDYVADRDQRGWVFNNYLGNKHRLIE